MQPLLAALIALVPYVGQGPAAVLDRGVAELASLVKGWKDGKVWVADGDAPASGPPLSQALSALALVGAVAAVLAVTVLRPRPPAR